MYNIKHGKKTIPIEFNAMAAKNFEESFDKAFHEAVGSGRMSLVIPAIYEGIKEGYRLQKKEVDLDIMELWESSIVDENSLLFKALDLFQKEEKK